LQQALAISQEIGDRIGEGTMLNNIGEIYRYLGQYPLALDYLQQALPIRQEVDDRVGEATTLNNLGLVHHSQGQYTRALDYFQRALAITREIGDRWTEATTLNNIGEVYYSLSRYGQARDYLQQSLAVRKEIGDRAGEETTLQNIGAIYYSLGQYPQALEYYQQALAIVQEIGDQAMEGTILNNIGSVYGGLEEYARALDHHEQALAILQEIGLREMEAVALSNTGEIYRKLGQYPEALDYAQQALAISQEIGDLEGESVTLSNIGFLHQQQGNGADAILYYQQAITVIESIQADIKVEELKASFATEQTGTYEYLIGLLWEEARFQEAFSYAERARARAFLDQLAGGALDFRGGADADLLKSEQALRNEITSLRAQLVTLRNRPSAEWNIDAIATTQADLGAREADYAQLLIYIKVQSPEVASLVSVDVASIGDVQALLDVNITLVEYFVTNDRTLAFIITQDTFEPVSVDVSRDELAKTITTFRGFASLDDPYPASLKQLYTWLISPLKDKLKTPIIGIIPHSILHYLPFAALTDGTQYLSDDFSLFTLPSASVLRFIQENRKMDAGTMVVLGNPTTDLPSLQFAEQEADSIASLYDIPALLGLDATESVLRSQAGNAGILHLAAHGEYNPNNPLFSAIYLAADSENDGRLEVHEIYGLNLTTVTDLVVLSACQTNIGAVSAGDEVVGLNRAFIYAGAPTVIASLWNVDDAATALLMERFYTHLRSGMSKGEALRQAQMDVRAQYSHPYYWSAFVLTGDAGSPAEVKSAPRSRASNRVWSLAWISSALLGMCCLGLMAILVGAMAWKRRRKREVR
jgi:CHAT domain-containing protein/Tfp pilus assembly protein PilF